MASPASCIRVKLLLQEDKAYSSCDFEYSLILNEYSILIGTVDVMGKEQRVDPLEAEFFYTN
jgi:hypothetical protein